MYKRKVIKLVKDNFLWFILKGQFAQITKRIIILLFSSGVEPYKYVRIHLMRIWHICFIDYTSTLIMWINKPGHWFWEDTMLLSFSNVNVFKCFVVWIRATIKDNFNGQINVLIIFSINQLMFLMSNVIKKKRWCLQNACFVQPAVQIPQIFSLQSYKIEKRTTSSHLRKLEAANIWHYCLKNDRNSCILIFLIE